MLPATWSSSMIRIFFTLSGGGHGRGQTRLRREKLFHRLILAPRIFANREGVRQRASRACLFEAAHQLSEPHHAERGAGADATMGDAADFGGLVRGNRRIDLREL